MQMTLGGVNRDRMGWAGIAPSDPSKSFYGALVSGMGGAEGFIGKLQAQVLMACVLGSCPERLRENSAGPDATFRQAAREAHLDDDFAARILVLAREGGTPAVLPHRQPGSLASFFENPNAVAFSDVRKDAGSQCVVLRDTSGNELWIHAREGQLALSLHDRDRTVDTAAWPLSPSVAREVHRFLKVALAVWDRSDKAQRKPDASTFRAVGYRFQSLLESLAAKAF